VVRIVVGVPAAAAIAGALLLAKLYHDEARLRDVVAAVRARGEPLAWGNLAARALPPEQDAARHHRQAVRLHRQAFAIDASGRADRSRPRTAELVDLLRDTVVIHPGLRARRAADVAEILARSKEALPHCRRARACAGADWGLDAAAPTFRWAPPDLRELSDLANVLCLAGLAANERGEKLEALEHLRDAMALARSVESMPLLAAFQTADDARHTVCAAVEEMAPSLSRPPLDAEARRAVRGLIGDLLRADQFDRAILGERSVTYELAERARTGELSLTALPRWPQGRSSMVAIRRLRLGVFLPRFLAAEEAELLEKMAGDVEAARAGSFPAASEARRTLPEARFANASFSLLVLLLPHMNRAFKVRFRNLAGRRMAAAALAMGLWELDRGRRPATLGELVPEYLPAVPADPFAAEGEPIRYFAARDRPRLYSVFKNGRDDAGGFFVGSRGYLDLVDSPDLVFFLNGDRPVPRMAARPRSGPAGGPL
jgi:hypothetical protein